MDGVTPHDYTMEEKIDKLLEEETKVITEERDTFKAAFKESVKLYAIHTLGLDTLDSKSLSVSNGYLRALENEILRYSRGNSAVKERSD